ncbi:NAD(P)/FAD-dependent oxidoreductase [Phenylobacterium deserti]|uniref:Aminoacetone oxidase family FAD-binding enzyme n=2 Tax=Phenylobacterium TaxID=20 RepID=A0A328AZ18_9CAUL|nr:TIGR03862 family flavoprotein [Phenylobacterium deserti]RAK58068.1 aminoacetone oxidase family FAD-binding enzyme [Phenylobacterium deserti]
MCPDMKTAAVIGGGPAGLMAAEVLANAEVAVTVYEKMPSVGRKLLMAGRGGLNLTHSEDFEAFVARYGAAAPRLRPLLEAFPPAALMAWAEDLGQPLFTGTSGRVFPKALKASPLLRAWLRRLDGRGVQVRTRAAWQGWTQDGALQIDGQAVRPDITILALGGASWPRLGSDGAWAGLLQDEGVAVTPFQPSNMGVNVPWSDVLLSRFEGQPLKNVRLSGGGASVLGETVVTRYGLEGGAVYAISAALREAVANGAGMLEIDLRPDLTVQKLTSRLAVERRGQSLATFLRKAAGLSPLEISLLREAHGVQLPAEPGPLARAIKAAPLKLTGVQGLDRAISSAGGVALEAVDADLMLSARPGVFVAGEMLDWEAPTGGYLLQASFATGVAAAQGALRRLEA